MSVALKRWLYPHAPMLCAFTVCAVFMCAAHVSSREYLEKQPIQVAADPFALKNPNAFDPARRRAVRAMKEPRETVSRMAHGIDTAESEALPRTDDDEVPSRLSLNSP